MTLPEALVQNPKYLIRLDAAGAALSVLLSGVVLPRFTDLHGIPVDMLHTLAGMAVVYLIYGLWCLLRWSAAAAPLRLRQLSIMNVSYAVFSVVLALFQTDLITSWGWAILLAEAVVVLLLAGLEYGVFSILKQQGEKP